MSKWKREAWRHESLRTLSSVNSVGVRRSSEPVHSPIASACANLPVLQLLISYNPYELQGVVVHAKQRERRPVTVRAGPRRGISCGTRLQGRKCLPVTILASNLRAVSNDRMAMMLLSRRSVNKGAQGRCINMLPLYEVVDTTQPFTLCQEVPNAGVLASFRSVRADSRTRRRQVVVKGDTGRDVLCQVYAGGMSYMRGQDCSGLRSRTSRVSERECRVCWRKLSDGHISGAVVRVERLAKLL